MDPALTYYVPFSRRIDEVKRMEQRATVEDLMYASVLERFLSLGVEMMGSMENVAGDYGNLIRSSGYQR